MIGAEYTVTDTGERIDSFVSEKAEVSRSRAVKLIEEEYVTVNGNSVSTS